MPKYKVDFYRNRDEGQMNPEEREVLYNYVFEHKPKTVVEVGTCRGGGSTYFISSAIANSEAETRFITIESYKEYWDYAQKLYNTDLAYLKPYIEFKFGNSIKLWPGLLDIKIDMLLLDAGIDALGMVYDFVYGQTNMPIGSMLFLHDWDNGKTTLIKKIVVGNDDWEFQGQMLGLVWFKRVRDSRGMLL